MKHFINAVFVCAGSIVPFGPVMQYATEKPADPIELCVYSGAGLYRVQPQN
jgi:alpha-D-xyloside xylohydrolase